MVDHGQKAYQALICEAGGVAKSAAVMKVSTSRVVDWGKQTEGRAAWRSTFRPYPSPFPALDLISERTFGDSSFLGRWSTQTGRTLDHFRSESIELPQLFGDRENFLLHARALQISISSAGRWWEVPLRWPEVWASIDRLARHLGYAGWIEAVCSWDERDVRVPVPAEGIRAMLPAEMNPAKIWPPPWR